MGWKLEDAVIKVLFGFVLLLVGFACYLMFKVIFTEPRVDTKIHLINVIYTGTFVNTMYDFNNVDYEEINLNKITITSYNNEAKQTDDSPNIMASNRLVYEGAVAISRDLKTKYNLKWGDLVYVETLQKYFVIEDLMNEKFKNRIDIFSFNKDWSLRLHLKSQKITIYKIKRG